MNIKLKKQPDINDYFDALCSTAEFTNDLKPEDRINSSKDGFHIIRSLVVKIDSRPDQIIEQVDNALKSLELTCLAIFNLGYDIKIESMNWHSVKDSCWNIFGDKGFFILKVKLENKI